MSIRGSDFGAKICERDPQVLLCTHKSTQKNLTKTFNTVRPMFFSRAFLPAATQSPAFYTKQFLSGPQIFIVLYGNT